MPFRFKLSEIIVLGVLTDLALATSKAKGFNRIEACAVSVGLTIGKVSKQAGISVGAVRYYESLGLLTSERGQNGYRYYDAAAVKQVQFIKKAQTLGFSLDDIHDILTVREQGNVPCEFVQTLLQDKIQHLEQQIQQMQAFKAELEAYHENWQLLQPQQGDICPLIETVEIEA